MITIINRVYLCLSITIIFNFFLYTKDRKLLFVFLFIIDSVMYELQIYASLYVHIAALFFIYKFHYESKAKSPFYALATISIVSMTIIIWSALAQLFTSYAPNVLHRLDTAIALLILLSNTFIYRYMQRNITEKTNIEDLQLNKINAVIFTYFVFGVSVLPEVAQPEKIIYTVGNIGFALSSIALIILILQTLKLIKRESSVLSEKEANKRLKEMLDIREMEQAKYRHYILSLFKNTLLYIDTNDIDGLNSYIINKLMPNRRHVEADRKEFILSKLKFISVEEIKILVYHKVIEALRLNVIVAISINEYIDSFFISQNDLYFVLNIFFENAINNLALESTRAKRLMLSFVVNDDYIVINIRNTLQDTQLPDYGYGDGLNMAKNTLSKYSNVEWHTEITVNYYLQAITILKKG